jgi:hypothetical protein
MAKFYHYVVSYDTENKEFAVDWDTTLVLLEENQGTIWNGDSQEWESMDTHRADYEDMSYRLGKLIGD